MYIKLFSALDCTDVQSLS